MFRLDLEHWPLLERAVKAHGSIQGAVLAGLQALGEPAVESPAGPEPEARPSPRTPQRERTKRARPGPAAPAAPVVEPGDDEEIPARVAARMLGLKSGTVRGYIRSGRLTGRYDGEPSFRGWLTTPDAVDEYRRARP